MLGGSKSPWEQARESGQGVVCLPPRKLAAALGRNGQHLEPVAPSESAAGKPGFVMQEHVV